MFRSLLIDPLDATDILAAQVAPDAVQPGQVLIASRVARDGAGRPLLVDLDRLIEHRAAKVRRRGVDAPAAGLEEV